jgi:Calx-beta domain
MQPWFFFGIKEISMYEGETVEIPLLKEGKGRGDAWVATSSGTGPAGASEVDYLPVKRLVHFSETESCKWINVTALIDYKTEPDEIFRLQLLATVQGSVGMPNIVIITIKDRG